ncbi:MAG: hypothetical protein QM622_00185 [Microbacterium sp.]
MRVDERLQLLGLRAAAVLDQHALVGLRGLQQQRVVISTAT